MRSTDRLGHEVSGATTEAVARYDAAVDSLLRFGDDVVERWEAAVAGEPAFALGHVGRAYLRCISSEGGDATDARAILDAIDPAVALTDREQRHLVAARAYAAGDLHGAAGHLAALSVEYPRDALALSVGHQLDFFTGDAVSLRDRIGRVLLAWDHDDPHFGFALGMYAFGLEECGLYEQARDAGVRALEHDRRDVWAHHAIVHTYEMQGRFHDGIRFVEERRGDWTDGNVFVVHNAWHEGLYRLEAGDLATVLAIYDDTVRPTDSSVALEMVDASALLWRLHLDGADVGDRWTALADAWARTTDHPWYVFNDAHAVMAFVGAGRLDAARAVVDHLRQYLSAATDALESNQAMTAEVGLPVCEALVAFGEGRYDRTVALLHPTRTVLHRFGGSHAQRDALARTLVTAAARAGEHALATALVSERLAVSPGSPWSWMQLAALREVRGDAVGSAAAERHARALRSPSPGYAPAISGTP